MDTLLLKDLLRALKAVQVQAIKLQKDIHAPSFVRTPFGICLAVETYLNTALVNPEIYATRRNLKQLFRKCPSFSGDMLYPVKHPELAPQRAFGTSDGTEMWGSGEYADNRRQLLKEAIELLERKLEGATLNNH